MFFTKEKVLLLFAFAAVFAMILASAAQASPASDARERYLEDRAACLEGRTHTDQATCLREAGAAQDAARRGELTERSGDYERNRLARCNYLPEPDRGYCIRRMHGEGTVSGSVAGGGILRELIVTVPAGAETTRR